jgi:hypothetical protein
MEEQMTAPEKETVRGGGAKKVDKDDFSAGFHGS